jgi:hypothetical protein
VQWEFYFEGDEIPDFSHAPAIPEDWGMLRTSIFSSAAYQSVSADCVSSSAKVLALTRFENEARSGDPNLQFLQLFWSVVIQLLAPTAKPAPETIDEWNDICESAGMRFTFDRQTALINLD